MGADSVFVPDAVAARAECGVFSLSRRSPNDVVGALELEHLAPASGFVWF